MSIPKPPERPADIVMQAHRFVGCHDRPGPKRKYSTRLWICPVCGQAWLATRRQPLNCTPQGLSWWWARWPDEAGTHPRLGDQ